MALLIFILILVALIVVHEFGHFIAAKLSGIRVDEFGIFFPPRLFSFRWKGTVYSLNALPFGGFVKIFGENGDTSADVGAPQGDGPRTEQFHSSEIAYPESAAGVGVSFTQKSRWIQARVVVAGIVFNFLAAWVILTAGYMYGMPTSADHEGVGLVQNAHPTIVAVLPDSPATKAGLQAGDTIVKVITGNTEIKTGATAEDVTDFIGKHQNESIGFVVERNNEQVSAIAVPVAGLAEGKKVVGIQLDDVGILKLSLPMALVQGAYLGKEITISTASGLAGFFGQIFRGHANFSEVSGPIGIVSMGGNAVKEGFVETIILTALISINLGLLNLIPIPGLDGGRLLFIAIEGITKRPISPRITMAFTLTGLGLLVLLMLVASYHDVLNLVHPAA
ncbi:MAG TPA: M50 family metallopeptidase [Candidatus Paceibacterota bacterium]|nr:M50 family metallopeptidase [Candidatus Paceibacterota bacterium]